jgi:4-hydroxybenzoate polyprenyltransferase
MPVTEQEKRLMMVCVGVVFFTILAIIVFLLIPSQQILFYVSAILAIALGFYLAFSLSKEQQPKEQQNRKKK